MSSTPSRETRASFKATKPGDDTFSARLRLMRESRDFSMAELARKSGVTKAYIVRMETGRPKMPNVTLAMVDRLAEALGCSPAWLAYGRQDGKS